MLYLALIPVFILGLYIYLRDSNREPLFSVIKAFFGGWLVVVLVSIVHYVFPTYVFDSVPLLRAFVSAALVEELCKFIVLYWIVWKSQDFDEPFDGIVYAAFVSLGFAFVEDLMYIMESSDPFGTGLARAFTAVPAHFFFGVIMGFHFGLARFVPLAYRVMRLSLAVILPVLFHGLYDFMLMQAEWLNQNGAGQVAALFIVGFYIFDFILWRVAVKRIKKMKNLSIPE